MDANQEKSGREEKDDFDHELRADEVCDPTSALVAGLSGCQCAISTTAAHLRVRHRESFSLNDHRSFVAWTLALVIYCTCRNMKEGSALHIYLYQLCHPAS
jgi:hypothetical protein